MTPSVSPSIISDNTAYVPNPTEGTLGERKVKAHYPEIGENALKNKGISWQGVAKKVAMVAFVVLISAAIGFLAGGFVGAGIGAAAGLCAVGALVLAKKIHDYFDRVHFLRQLPTEGNHASKLPENAPKVGKYYDSKVILTKTADEGLEWKKKLIHAAEESIELSANYAGGSDFRDILAIIDAKMLQKTHIKTHILLSRDLLEDQDMQILEKMKETFKDRFEVLHSDKYYQLDLDFHTEENHIKMLVVDGKYFVAGGTSIHPRFCHENYNPELDKENPTLAARLLEPAARDTDVVGESAELGKAMRDQFFNLFRLWEIKTLANDKIASRYYALNEAVSASVAEFHELPTVKMKFVVSGPEHRGNNAIVKEYQKRILNSKNEIRIGANRFCPSKKIRNALVDVKAQNPNIKRTAYLNGMGEGFSIGHARVTQIHSGRAHYDLVDKVYEYNRQHQFYHKKVATFDNTHMIIGSFNHGRKSTRYDNEMVFVIKNSELTAQCKQTLKEDGKRSIKVTADYHSQRPLLQRVLSFVFHKATENFV